MDEEVVLKVTLLLYRDGTFRVEREKAEDISAEFAPILTAGLVQMSTTFLSKSDVISSKGHNDA